MHYGYEDELHNVMAKEFEKKVGTSIPIKVDKITPDQKAIQREHGAEGGFMPIIIQTMKLMNSQTTSI